MTTVVVVGSGIAGLAAALHARAAGCTVTLVTKDVLGHTNTRFAQGGIAGVLFPDDSVDAHIRDTLAAGAGLSDPAAVRVLATEGALRIGELVELGVAFDRDADGAFRKGREAAHSYPRIVHAGGDATGRAIEHALVRAVRAAGLRVIEHAFLLGVVQTPRRVTGIDVARTAPAPAAGAAGGAGRAVPDPLRLHADAVVLATGGVGRLYAHTTNPPVATGDGIAAALRLGAAVSDLEFVQFHPTVLPGDEPFLVSEAVRGEGAVLIDDDGRRFAFDAHPDGELAPRDVVARAIARQVTAQNGRPVRLDATGIRPTPGATAAFLAERFPTIDAAVRARGWDWAREPIPVTPAAHYLMGGIDTDLHGRTSVPGLYAVGEVARTGVHGANRLASNSLLEGAVFGARAGDVIAGDARLPWPASAPTAAATTIATATPAAAALPAFTRGALQRLMWQAAGLERDEPGLAHAASVLAGWRADAREPRTAAEHEDANLLLVAEHLVAAAHARTASVGAHHRRDAVPALVTQGAV
ncbi:L-aspartate oxidase [Microbacterium sp. zg-Y818]|uniref:L-aspartate oxidase n=1 Tax=unclassified Microbacterium TaxID=2609290 RepID=UPI00214A9BB3|nr:MULTISPECIES: L-aspartate oxidase [unclassified Microbacterium]MCR2801295.1 L-aspartate oxidase [Microbacterium sp. zg.Y818]WIM21126.1 L-aspartate oxidase [Microbacterium sp. zg-Y818]